MWVSKGQWLGIGLLLPSLPPPRMFRQLRAGRGAEHWEKGEVPVGRPTGTLIKM